MSLPKASAAAVIRCRGRRARRTANHETKAISTPKGRDWPESALLDLRRHPPLSLMQQAERVAIGKASHTPSSGGPGGPGGSPATSWRGKRTVASTVMMFPMRSSKALAEVRRRQAIALVGRRCAIPPRLKPASALRAARWQRREQADRVGKALGRLATVKVRDDLAAIALGEPEGQCRRSGNADEQHEKNAQRQRGRGEPRFIIALSTGQART